METPQQNPFGWIEIYVEDMARAQKFYETVFQLSLTPADLSTEDFGDLEMLFFPYNPELGNISGALCKTSNNKPGAGGTMVYLSCTDCAHEAARVSAAGGEILQQKMPIGQFGFCAIMMDTEGNMLGLHSMQ